MGKKYGDIRYKWLAERGVDVKKDSLQNAYSESLFAPPDEIQAVFCEAAAGTGKSVVSILIGAKGVLDGEYNKIVYIRNTEVVGKEIGFLKGDLEDKISPFMSPFVDALDLVRPTTYEDWEQRGMAFATTPTFLRGITFDKAYIIIDEAQNISLEELQMIYTRATSDCKIVTIGSLRQIDAPKLKRYMGLTPFEVYMKHFEGYDNIKYHTLTRNWRGWFSNHSDCVQDTVKFLEQNKIK